MLCPELLKLLMATDMQEPLDRSEKVVLMEPKAKELLALLVHRELTVL